MNNLRRGNFAGAARDVGGIPSRRGRRRFNKQYATDRAKAAANAWIELQYGWKPLISEVQGAAEALAELSFQRVTGKAKAQKSRELEIESTSALGQKTSSLSCSTTIFVKSSVLFSIDNSLASQLAGIGLTNPLSPAWELTPWSFIVDWFIPIGNTIAALDATIGVEFKAGSMTSVIKRRLTCLDIYSGSTQGYVVSARDELSILRIPMTNGFPEIPIPEFKSPLGWYHAANALALAVQRAK